MNIETKKTEITVNKTIGNCSTELMAETDIVLPENYPDISRILQLDGRAKIKEKEKGSDKVHIKGEAEITLLYVPDPDMSDLPVKSITATAPFSHVCEIMGITDNSIIKTSADVVNLDYSLLNSRKLTVRAAVETDITAMERQTEEFISDVEGAEIQESEEEVYREISDGSFELVIADKLQMPAGKPAILEVVKLDAEIGESNIKLISDKAVIKGTAKVSCLYISRRDASVEHTEHEILFTEIVDLPGVTEDMEPTADYRVTSVYFEADNDENGAGVLGVEIKADMDISVAGKDIIPLLSDCYRTDCDMRLIKDKCKMETISSVVRPQILVRGSIGIPMDSPPISEIYRVFGKPYIENISFENEMALIQGVLDVYILYVTSDNEMPLYNFKGEIPFSYSVDVGDNADVATDCSIRIDSLSYTLGSDSDIDIRANLSATIKFIKMKEFDIIQDIECKESEMPKNSSIVIYFVSEGDTLYKIAKKYRTTVDKIASVNKIDKNMTLRPGMKLLIP